MQREALRASVYSEIYARILSGAIGEERRVQDTTLAGELGVSRTPVREALLRLEREGLVQNLVGRGFRVTPLSPGEARDTYTILWTLEALAVRLSPRLDEDQRAVLDGIAARIERCRDPLRCVDLDNEWHERLTGRCGNPRLIRMIAELKGAIRRYELRYMLLRDLVGVSAKDHRGIASLALRSPAQAARALEEHWRVALDALEARMETE